MASIKLTGDTSGEITISAPAVAGTNTLTLPAATGNILTDGAVANNGIYLGGTASANLLDDYEEGTWTPIIAGTSTAGTATYTIQQGVYTKIGDIVYIHAYIGWNSGTGSGNLTITGLPFTSLSGYYYGLSMSGIAVLSGNTSGNVIFARCESNTSTIGIYAHGTGTTINDASYPYQSSGLMLWAGCYKAN